MVDCNTKCGNKIIREIILPPPDGNISYLCSMQICVFFFYCLPRLFLINFIKPFSSWRLPISFAGMWNTLPDCCRVPFRSIPVRSSWITSPSSVFQLSSLMAVVVPFSKYAHFFFSQQSKCNFTTVVNIYHWLGKKKQKKNRFTRAAFQYTHRPFTTCTTALATLPCHWASAGWRFAATSWLNAITATGYR